MDWGCLWNLTQFNTNTKLNLEWTECVMKIWTTACLKVLIMTEAGVKGASVNAKEW